ncbi:ABC transporter permease [Orrella sp. 11846]|uniref:ABC transporter permease n=1 Tax=Orrella sp. 11846 TaxID=3409913 RepID=UPI003B5B07C4
MWALALRRIISAVISIWIVLTLIFGLIHLSGDPIDVLAPPEMNQIDREAMRSHLGLDQPLHVQYGRFLQGLTKGDLGVSYYSKTSAFPMVAERFPVTLKLVLLSVVIAVGFSIPFGVFAAVYVNSPLDHVLRWLSVLGSSVPTFFLGILLIFLFSVELKWLPSSGIGSFSHYILPAFTLAFFRIALFTRMIRASLLDVLDSDYVRTARAKGLNERVVVLKHALRTALIPFVTVFGLQFGQLLAGAVVTETIFAIPGMNSLALSSLYRLDYPIILSYIAIVAILFNVINALVDLAYGLVDPRVRNER